MTARARRLLTYLALAVASYAVALAAGFKAALVAFLTAGAVCELLFWKELFWPRR